VSATPLPSDFVFTLCQPGAEATLKREVARIAPSWAAAYQRPGLVTFRSPEPVTPALVLTSVFARQHGMSLGTARDLEGALALLERLPGPVCLHVVDRDPADPDDPTAAPHVAALEAALRTQAPARFTPSTTAGEGQLVLSVVASAREPSLLLGCHVHTPGRSPFPGGRFPIALPAEAPSRAYLKIEEAIRAFALPLRAGQTALEIGAAPGGAAYALAQRGLHVLAVDPAAMDPALLARTFHSGARVTHYPIPAAELGKEPLPRPVDWLLMDVHLAPQIAMRAARKLASQHKATLRGAVLTLKLNDWAFADRIDAFLQQAREMGLVDPRARQLGSHRQELAIVGLTKSARSRV